MKHFLVNLTTILFLTLGTSLAEQPILDVKILNALVGEEVEAGVVPVSNIKRIKAEITFDKKDNATLRAFSGTAVNVSAQLPENFLAVTINDTTGAEIPVKVGVTGTNMVEGKQGLRITIEIPDLQENRMNKIGNYLDAMHATALQQDPDAANKITARREQIVAALDKSFMENIVGRFNLTVKYTSSQPGAWNGEVSAPITTIEVKNKGTFFSTPGN